MDNGIQQVDKCSGIFVVGKYALLRWLLIKDKCSWNIFSSKKNKYFLPGIGKFSWSGLDVLTIPHICHLNHLYIGGEKSVMWRKFQTSMDGWMDAHFGPWVWPLSGDYSLASNPSTQLLRCNALGWVIPANNLSHSCKYSTGVNLTVLGCWWCNYNCQLRKAPPTTVFN